MSWNPLSNGRLASGTADIPQYLKAGIRVGMGVDGEASADLADPFENLRTGLYAIRDKYENAAIMSPYDVLRLHTVGSADVLGVADKLGSLEPGKQADFLVIDPTRFGHIFDPYATLVFVTSQPDLERVYVAGDLQVEHGTLLHQTSTRSSTKSISASASAPNSRFGTGYQLAREEGGVVRYRRSRTASLRKTASARGEPKQLSHSQPQNVHKLPSPFLRKQFS